MLTPDDRDALAEALKKDEGTGPMKQGRFLPYQCPADKLTIGYGRNLERGISQAAADFLLAEDIDDIDKDLSRLFPWAASMVPVRRRVLANMAYNLGISRLLGFRRTLEAMRNGFYAEAAREMRASRWAQQVGARAERLARDMETGLDSSGRL